jgi:hypothetical protein
VLDSAGYGNVTITKSVTIEAPAGVYAGISVFTGTDGITVAAPSGTVVLRGLKVTGQGGNNGINFVQGSQLVIERCDVGGMQLAGIRATLAAGGALDVYDTVVAHNAGNSAVFVSGGGRVSIERVDVSGNAGTGIMLEDGIDASLRDIVVTRNGLGGVRVRADTLETAMTVAASRIYRNGAEGIGVDAHGAIGVNVAVSDSDVVSNNWQQFAAGGIVAQSNAASGVANISVLRTNASFNHGSGVLALNTGAAVYVDASVVTDNSDFGIAASNGAAANSQTTNTVENNVAGATSNVTTYVGL